VYTPQIVTRRELLIGSAITAGVTGYGRSQNLQEKLNRIAIMTLAFNSLLKSEAHPDDPKRTLDILDAPAMIADRFGVHHVEVQHAHFASTESSYLREFRGRLKKAKSRMNQICLEFGPLNISSPDPVLRRETIDLTKQWIDHAVELGCPRVMVNQGTLAPEVRQSAIATLKTIGEYGRSQKVFVTMENRGSGATQTAAGWEVVVEVIKAAGIYANPDIGNFPNEEARAAGLRVMYPLSSGSSHAHYDPSRYSEANAIKISKEVGYKGLYSIEATSRNGPDPYTAVQTILDELVKDL
jgi:sugar phosphate isomerase/epimerase